MILKLRTGFFIPLKSELTASELPRTERPLQLPLRQATKAALEPVTVASALERVSPI